MWIEPHIPGDLGEVGEGCRMEDSQEVQGIMGDASEVEKKLSEVKVLRIWQLFSKFAFSTCNSGIISSLGNLLDM